MENIVFERDYEEEHRQQDGNDAASAIFEIATDGGFIAAYADAMQVIPKVVVPADKENYEYLLQRSDELAQRWGGKVRGVVNYEKWEATIDLLLPFAEFCDRDDLSLLKEFADKSHSITFQTNDDGRLRSFSSFILKRLPTRTRSLSQFCATGQILPLFWSSTGKRTHPFLKAMMKSIILMIPSGLS